MFPMIMFHTNERECSIYLIIYMSSSILSEVSPIFYDILRKLAEELYREYVDKRVTYRDNLKVTSTNDMVF